MFYSLPTHNGFQCAGRGAGPNENVGNKKYRSLCLERKEEYTKTTMRSEKTVIAEWVFRKVKEHGGRFMRIVDGETTSSSSSKNQTRYIEVERTVALEKIRQSLRQVLNRPKNRSPTKKTNGKTTTNGSTDETESKVKTELGTTIVELPTSSVSTSLKRSSDTTQNPTHSITTTTTITPPPPREELQRYKLILSYDGTRYKGWQRQSSSSSSTGNDGSISTSSPNARNWKKRKHDNTGRVMPIPLTIQESLEDALEQYSSLDRNVLRVRMAGRTDAGVHAKGQVVVVSLVRPNSEYNTSKDVECWEIRKSINSRLPRDLCVVDISTCNESFDPRQDVVTKQYSYTIRYRRKTLHANGKDVLPICIKGGPELLRSAFDDDNNHCWLVPWALDDSKLEQYCKLLCGEHDFSAFVHKKARNERDNGCKPVTRFECVRTRTTWLDGSDTPSVCDVRFEVEAQGFGRSQVRNLIGYIVDICRGIIQEYDTVEEWLWKVSTDEVAKTIHAAPACGLCLEWVKYALPG
jgi:tRNA pseudouridine38-40 synthase